MKRAVTIHVFEESDLPAILRIEGASFKREAWSRKAFLEYAGAAPDLFLVAKVEGSVAGYSIACLARQGAEIASLAVSPRYRQRGIATALLRRTLRKLRQRGAQAVWLMVRRDNEEAIQLYRKLGFLRMGIVPDYYEDNASGWRMRIGLGLPSSPAVVAPKRKAKQ